MTPNDATPAEIGAAYFSQRIEFGRKENIPLTNELLATHVTGAILVAIAAERERCAEIAQNNRFGWHTEYDLFAKQKSDGIARDIREGE